MSFLLTDFGGNLRLILQDNDDIIQWEPYNIGATYGYYGAPMYTDVEWPRSRFVGPIITADGPILDTIACNWYYWNWLNIKNGGTQGRVDIYGITQTASGTPVGNVAISLYDNVLDSVVDTATSDSGGNWVAGSPYLNTVYAVGYLANEPTSPDQFGTTLQTIPG